MKDEAGGSRRLSVVTESAGFGVPGPLEAEAAALQSRADLAMKAAVLLPGPVRQLVTDQAALLVALARRIERRADQ